MMKFIAISDTHGLHAQLRLPKGDVLLHAGDVCSRGTEKEALNFLAWFREQDYKYKIFIAGNHDFYFEKNTSALINKIIPENVIYLCDSGAQIEGINIWGSPVSPWFYNWAFNRYRGSDIKKHWDKIPHHTDILITHGPVFGKLDITVQGEQVGCVDLLNALEKINPKIHLCGHIHEAYGEIKSTKTTFLNASVLDENYRLVNEPMIFDL
jgi:Icc-related predicted phosphoesterase